MRVENRLGRQFVPEEWQEIDIEGGRTRCPYLRMIPEAADIFPPRWKKLFHFDRHKSDSFSCAFFSIAVQ